MFNTKTHITIKKGHDLSPSEIDSIFATKAAQWGNSVMDDLQKEELFFILKDESGHILSHAQLEEISGVLFDNVPYGIYGIGAVISAIRGKGYGRLLMNGVRNFLCEQGKTGIGFTGVPEFYKKCGYDIGDSALLNRYVYQSHGTEIVNTSDPYILSFDGGDGFMKKVLDSPDKKVYLPRTPDW